MATNELPPLSDDSISQRTQIYPSYSAGRRKIYIQLYAKNRSSNAQDHERFASVISENLRELRNKWIVTGEAPVGPLKAHKNIFLTQACARFNDIERHGMDDDDIQNLAAQLLEPCHFQGAPTIPLLLCLREEHPAGHFKGNFVAVEFLNRFESILPGRKIPTGQGNIPDAVGEIAWTLCIVIPAAYYAVQSFQRCRSMVRSSSQPGSNGDTSTATNLTNELASIVNRHQSQVDIITHIVEFVNKASTPPWQRNQLQTLSQGRAELRSTLPPFQAAFDEVESQVQFYLSMPDNKQLSVEQVIELTQLMATLSRQANTIATVLDDLAPRLDKQYTKEKVYYKTFTAVAGVAVIATVAFCWWNPLGWQAATSYAISAYKARTAVSAVAACASAGTSLVCGSQACTESKQRELMQQVRTDHLRFNDVKDRMAAFLVLYLFREQLESMPEKYLTDICEKMGIQPHLVSVEKYNLALWKTTWEEFFQSYRKYFASIQDLSRSLE